MVTRATRFDRDTSWGVLEHYSGQTTTTWRLEKNVGKWWACLVSVYQTLWACGVTRHLMILQIKTSLNNWKAFWTVRKKESCARKYSSTILFAIYIVTKLKASLFYHPTQAEQLWMKQRNVLNSGVFVLSRNRLPEQCAQHGMLHLPRTKFHIARRF